MQLRTWSSWWSWGHERPWRDEGRQGKGQGWSKEGRASKALGMDHLNAILVSKRRVRLTRHFCLRIFTAVAFCLSVYLLDYRLK